MLSLFLYVALLGTIGAVGFYAAKMLVRGLTRCVSRPRRRSQAVRNDPKDAVLYRAEDLGYKLAKGETDYTAYERPTYLRVQAAA